MAKTLTRSANKKVAGVCGGIAEHFDIDPVIVRLVWLAAVLLYGSGVVLYIILWLVLPPPQ